eukprot:5517752-Alexandrium_andersonii.AAC.1
MSVGLRAPWQLPLAAASEAEPLGGFRREARPPGRLPLQLGGPARTLRAGRPHAEPTHAPDAVAHSRFAYE